MDCARRVRVGWARECPSRAAFNINAKRAENVSVSATEILAGVVLNQCFSNVLLVHTTSLRANPGTWSQKWPKGNLFETPGCESRTKDLTISDQSG
jgi:hypothetical protein